MRSSMFASAFGVIAVVGAALIAPAPVSAAEALPATVARQLDEQPVGFTASAAHERRMEIIRNTQRQQRYQGRGGYGRGGYGPGGYGRGGYAQPRGYGYGRQPGINGNRPEYSDPREYTR